MDILYIYLGIVINKWWFYVTTGLFLFDEFGKRKSPKWKRYFGRVPEKTRRQLELSLIIFGLLYAGFIAFQEQYEQTQHQNKTINELTKTTPTGQQARISELEQELGAFKAAEAIRNAKEWPTITGEQGKKSVEILAKHKNEKPHILIHCIEDNLYCARWRSIFSAAGWNVMPPLEKLTKMIIGINILAEKETLILADIVSALETANLPVHKVIPSDQEGINMVKDKYILIIGLKMEVIEEWKK